MKNHNASTRVIESRTDLSRRCSTRIASIQCHGSATNQGALSCRPRIIKLSDSVLVIFKSESLRHGYVNVAHVL